MKTYKVKINSYLHFEVKANDILEAIEEAVKEANNFTTGTTKNDIVAIMEIEYYRSHS